MSTHENNIQLPNENLIDENINELTLSLTSWEDVVKLNQHKIILELEKRKLKTVGKFAELRSRLFRYIKGDWSPSDFINDNINMTDKTPFYKPNKFSGAIHENVNSFIKIYNKASATNGWSSEQKKSFLPIYLENTAATFLDNLENNNPTATWEQVEQALRLEFEPTAQSHMLRTMLEKRKQLPDETTASYINDAENLCKRIDPNMSQSELTHTIMKGLKPEISRYVGILDNFNLEELKKNIRKYESIEFMINGNTIQSHDDIRSQITKEHINIIEDTKNKKQIDLLTTQMSKLESVINNFINNNNNINQSTNHATQNHTNRPNYNRNYNYEYQNYNKSNYRPNYNRSINNNNNNHNNYPPTPNNIYNNYNKYQNDHRSTPNNNYNYNNNRKNYSPNPNNNINYNNGSNYNNINKKIQCEHCNNYNHNGSECKWKLICTTCNKRYHTAETCYFNKTNPDQKNQ